MLPNKWIGWSVGWNTSEISSEVHWEEVPVGGKLDCHSIVRFVSNMKRHCEWEDVMARFGESADMVYSSVREMFWHVPIVQIRGWKPLICVPVKCGAQIITMNLDALESNWLYGADDAEIGLIVNREPSKVEWKNRNLRRRIVQRIFSMRLDAYIDCRFFSAVLNKNLSVIETNIHSPLLQGMCQVMDAKPRNFVSKLRSCGWILVRLDNLNCIWQTLDEWMIRFPCMKKMGLTMFADGDVMDEIHQMEWRQSDFKLDQLDLCVVWSVCDEDIDVHQSQFATYIQSEATEFALKISIKFI